MNIRSTADLKNHFAKGVLFENFIINELMKNCFNSRVQPFFHYFRDSNGNEVDLIIKQSGYTHAIEIKSAKTINDYFFKGLNYYAALSSKKIKSHCVYGGEEHYVYEGHHVLGWNKLTQLSIK